MSTVPPPVTAPDTDRRRHGRSVRRRLPRRELGRLDPPAHRDPLALLAAQETTRLRELLPLRHERMAASPFAFFRGAAAVFSADLAGSPRSGLQVQLCGDAHLANFGGFASPERRLVFDINDFDETLPGPFEWDLKRLSASFEVAARHNGYDDAERVDLQRRVARRYARAVNRLAGLGHLDLWYETTDAEQVLLEQQGAVGAEVIRRVTRSLDKGRAKDRIRAMQRLTVRDGAELRFASDPPVLVPVAELVGESGRARMMRVVAEAVISYRSSLLPDRAHLLSRYRLVDLARKVVGVGSVGTRCWVALLVGRDDSDPLFLQVKEAQRSVLEPHLRSSAYDHQGRRVVEGQRLVQAASDIFLGWERLRSPDGSMRDFYIRQLWDWKTSASLETMEPDLFGLYAELCASVLARAHARTGDAAAIAAYVGGGRALGEALLSFAAAYADLNAADHAAAVAAWSPRGPVPAGP